MLFALVVWLVNSWKGCGQPSSIGIWVRKEQIVGGLGGIYRKCNMFVFERWKNLGKNIPRSWICTHSEATLSWKIDESRNARWRKTVNRRGRNGIRGGSWSIQWPMMRGKKNTGAFKNGKILRERSWASIFIKKTNLDQWLSVNFGNGCRTKKFWTENMVDITINVSERVSLETTIQKVIFTLPGHNPCRNPRSQLEQFASEGHINSRPI